MQKKVKTEAVVGDTDVLRDRMRMLPLNGAAYCFNNCYTAARRRIFIEFFRENDLRFSYLPPRSSTEAARDVEEFAAITTHKQQRHTSKFLELEHVQSFPISSSSSVEKSLQSSILKSQIAIPPQPTIDCR